MKVHRTGIILSPDRRRVLFRPFELQDPVRISRIVARVMQLAESEVARQIESVLSEFHGRHQRLEAYFLERFAAVKSYLLTDQPLTRNRQLLIGSYFTQEYALESAALFNPSIVWHPDQTGAPPGGRRFIVSLRATGEGHISSLCFRSGTVDSSGRIAIDPATRFVTPPRVVTSATYDKPLFQRKLLELGVSNGFSQLVFEHLPDSFDYEELQRGIEEILRVHRSKQTEWAETARCILGLAKANYTIACDPESQLSERVIFPYSPTESNGIEDARFVEFRDDDGERTYYATYTAYDGHLTFPQLVETKDFITFRIATLNGPEVRNKGMALFPRKLNGMYAMLSRQDGEHLYLMYSDNIHFWYSKELILKPTYPWEFVQIGNCGAPIETSEGWLVLTHGVGPMRKYSIGAVLLDRNDPTKVLGRLAEPLLVPDENEREGYVPNVVYSCGAVLFGHTLILPYAMADYASTFATIDLNELLGAML
ncbi:MAG: glycosidase [Planctomycetota bacterium]|nr:MAG: glycosidase [Planctomycetota bacterium]